MYTQYEIQAYYPEFNEWWNIGQIYEFSIPYMEKLDEAKEVLDKIIKEYQPKTNKQYRIVSREVTEWREVK